jgi:hypothetical protein
VRWLTSTASRPARNSSSARRSLASRLGFTRMSFLGCASRTRSSRQALPGRIDIVTALHACDTATDDAIRFALHKRPQFIVLVPCCQAEVAAILRRRKTESLARTPLSELWRHPLHTREFGSLVTNALRCLQLEAQGYQVTVTELVGWEHSLKNELIIASHTGASRHNAAVRLEQILHELIFWTSCGPFHLLTRKPMHPGTH